MESLYTLISPSTGEQVVTRIWTREEAFEGPYMHLAPDLTLSLRDGGMVSILASDMSVKPRREPSGTHRPEGIIISRGPGIRQGTTLNQIPILDVAPLLLYSLGLPVPEDMEGRVPAEVFEQSQLKRRPILVSGHSKSVAPAKEKKSVEVLYDAEAEAEVAARLRDLGYIE
jgi:predicted AlkP superfamily phosphohydrolase/phosphomutase